MDLPGKRAVLENPPNLNYEYVKAYVPAIARTYLRELAADRNFSEQRMLGVVLLEHERMTRAARREAPGLEPLIHPCGDR